MIDKLLAYIDREEHQHFLLLVVLSVVTFVSVIGIGIARFASASSNTYYISPTGSGFACTQVAPCGNFNTAYQVASSDDTVIVEAGSYPSQSIDYDGTKTTPVIFQVDRDGSGNAVSVTTQGVTVNGASHIVFDGRDADGVYRDHWQMGGLTVQAGGGHTPTDVAFYGLHYAQLNGDTTVYVEGPSNHISIIGGELGPNVGDGIQIAARTSDNAGTSNVLVQGLYCHDNDGESGGNPDCIEVKSADWHGNNKTYILGNYFENNDNSNLRCDAKSDNVIVANNIFKDTVAGDSLAGAGAAAGCKGSSTQYLYNTFAGSQQIQEPAQDANGWPRLYTLIGNVGAGGDQGCMAESTYSHNVWSGAGQACAGVNDQDGQNLKLNVDGSLQTGSPAIGAGDASMYPVVDYTGVARISPPDAGAVSFGHSFTTKPDNYTAQTIMTPDNTVTPTITGTTTVGQQLTATNGTWSNSPTGYRYQWQRCLSDYSKCFNIAGANNQTYTLTNTEANTHVSVVVQAINASGSMTAWSDYTSAVSSASPPPSNQTAPTISGTAIEANQLTTTNGTWTNSPTGYSYQWQRCDNSGANCTNISGAVSNTYSPVLADSAHTVRVVVTGASGAGSDTATSGASNLIQALIGDFNGDNSVNIFDLGIFLSHFLSSSSPDQDLNSDGVVNLFDLGIFLNHYNT